MVSFNGWVPNSVLAFVLFVSLFSFGCGSDDEKSGACDDVTCERGVCSDGACTNPSTCDLDSDCLGGYECTAAGSCVAEFPCETTDECPSGACINGACVNPTSCEENSDCIPGFGCEDNVCVEDTCAQVECDRGVCAVDSGECVNAEVCTNATEGTDCVDGFVCLAQECVDEATFCGQLECPRGVCDIDTKDCGNADMCSDDNDCVSGFYCDGGTCAANQCDANMTDCPRGVCNPTDSTCVNADTCTALADCLDGFYCINGGCQEIDTACVDCEGNQVCDYVENSQSVFCLENSLGCVNAIDCLNDRVCESGFCTTPVACTADANEPNNDVAGATDWQAATKVADRVEGSICDGDTDVFAFDIDAAANSTGTLVAIVTFDPEDVGLGQLQVELLDPAGTVLSTGMSTNGVARAEQVIGVLDTGIYTARVTQMGAISTAGIDYGIFMDIGEQATIDACAAATELTGNTSGDTTSGASTSLGGACVTEAGAPEDVYFFTLAARSFVSIGLTPTGRSSELTLGLRNNCEIDGSEFSCEASGTTGTTFEGFLDIGTYFVVIQSETVMGPGPYDLSFSAQVPVCAPGETMCVDANTATACNAQGTGFNTETCAQGCNAADGRCDRLAADVCYTATVATGGLQVTLDWESFTNDYDPGSACVGGSSDAVTGGQDAAYEIELQPNEAFVAEIVPGADDAALYVVRNCDDVSRTCLAGTNSGGSGVDEIVAYGNTTTDTQTVYLIADVSSNEFTFDPATLTITQGTMICSPGTTQCSGNFEQTCNVGGLAYDDRLCSFGCDTGTGLCIPPPNNQCGAGVIDVSAGGSWNATIDEYTDNFNPGFNGCANSTSAGADAVYQISGQPGDIVTATVSGDFDFVLYALTDCANTDSCIAGIDDELSGDPETLKFNLPDTNPVFIVVDGASSFSTTGQFNLNVSVQAPDCFNPGDAIACQSITTLDYCDSYGQTQQYTCTGDCVATSCVNPTGDVCHDAIPLSTIGSFTGNFADFTNDLDPGVGTCIREPFNEQDGRDAVFAVDMLANQTLEATLVTGDANAGMYILDGCASAANNCVWAADESNNLEFFAPSAGTYYLVVDSTTLSSSADFTLQLDSRLTDFCQPGGATCSGNTLTVCNASGTAVESTVVCSDGCSFGACNPPSTLNDTCADAYVVNGSVRLYDRFDRFNDDYNPGSAGCTGRSEPGLDHVYSITLAPNEVVAINLQAYASFLEPTAYLVTDCSDVTANCIWGSAGSDELLKDGYLNDTGMIQNLFLIIDSDSSFDDEPYLLDIEITPFECVGGTAVCADADTSEVCTDYGIFDNERCYFGCNGTTGLCNDPPNDQCGGAVVIPSSGGVFQARIEDFANDFNPGSGGCTGFNADGPDAAYEISLTAGDFVTVRQSGPFDGSVYMVTDCANLGTCVAGADSGGGDDQFQFVVQTTGTYFIIADAFTTLPTGVFTLTVDVQTPICTPGSSVCLDANTIQLCEAPGLVYSEATCTNGCGPFSCVNPTGESCFESLDANGAGPFTGMIDNATDDVDPDNFICADRPQDGPDVVYHVDVLAGQVVTADLTSTYNASLYATQSCTDVDEQCLAGSDGSSDETIAFSAPADGRYFLVVDTATTAPTGTYSLDVSIQNPICTANSNTCIDAMTLETCDSLGLMTSQQTCMFGCAAGACNTPPNDICTGAIDVTAGGTFSGTFAGAADDYTPDFFASCTGFDAIGPDLAYVVNLTAGQTVSATITATTPTQDTALYIVSACVPVVGTECLNGDDRFDGATLNGTGEMVSYTATGTETVYIIADNYDDLSLPASPTFDLVVTVQ